MPATAIAPLILFLFLLLAAAHVLGYLFARLRQPRVIGEILGGIILGPFVLGKLPGYTHLLQLDVAMAPKKAALDLLYWLGLLLLMFLSGAETKALFQRHERRQIAWLVTLGTGLPFFAMMLCASVLPLNRFRGAGGSQVPLVLVMSIAVAVTSIPVISRIFFDLNILHTRFARLVLGVAVLEDIVLWAVLAVATALFAAFLAGFAVSRKHLGQALETISRFSFALFIPAYFALVGYNLIFGKEFSVFMLVGFLSGACLIKLLSVALGARLGGFQGLDVVNLAVATNARGGPGIVLASVAYEVGIISPAFYTTLVLTAVLTSQAAGVWLEFVLRRGWTLLGESIQESAFSIQHPEVPLAIKDRTSGVEPSPEKSAA